jgi:hypothetical protein
MAINKSRQIDHRSWKSVARMSKPQSG